MGGPSGRSPSRRTGGTRDETHLERVRQRGEGNDHRPTGLGRGWHWRTRSGVRLAGSLSNGDGAACLYSLADDYRTSDHDDGSSDTSSVHGSDYNDRAKLDYNVNRADLDLDYNVNRAKLDYSTDDHYGDHIVYDDYDYDHPDILGHIGGAGCAEDKENRGTR